MNIKKVPVDYCFSNLLHDPSHGVSENAIEFAVERISVRI